VLNPENGLFIFFFVYLLRKTDITHNNNNGYSVTISVKLRIKTIKQVFSFQPNNWFATICIILRHRLSSSFLCTNYFHGLL